MSQDTIIKWFKKTRLYPEEVEEDDDPFEGENELPALQELMDKVGSSCNAEVFIFAEDSINVCSGNIDKTNANWRNELRKQIIDDEDVMLSAPAEKQDRTNEEEDEVDPELKQPLIKTVQKAGEVAEQLKDFAQFNGHEELSLALSKWAICSIKSGKIRSRKLQSTITDFFTSCSMQNFINAIAFQATLVLYKHELPWITWCFSNILCYCCCEPVQYTVCLLYTSPSPRDA